MAEPVVPHFRNDDGVETIEIGAREFKCTGASPPNDHPHVYLDMGEDDHIVCPYCSALYRLNSDLGTAEAKPASCAYPGGAV